MKLISTERALEITGLANKRELWREIALFNQRTPNHKVIQRRGKFDLHTLCVACKADYYDKEEAQ